MKVFGMRPPADQVETAVFGLDALDDPAAGFLMPDGLGDGDPFDLFVADHRSQLRASPLRVRQYLRPADVGDVGDGAVPLQFQFALADLTPRV